MVEIISNLCNEEIQSNSKRYTQRAQTHRYCFQIFYEKIQNLIIYELSLKGSHTLNTITNNL